MKNINTKTVVAIGIGAALYGVLSLFSIPIGPNTSFILAVAILAIFGAIYGPVAGFFIGFLGHALKDALLYGSVWWSWVFLSALMGLCLGLIKLDKSFDVLNGQVKPNHIVKLYLLAVLGVIVGDLVAWAGDVFVYGEPATKVILQIILASLSNLFVISIIGIPAVIIIGKMNSRNIGIDQK